MPPKPILIYKLAPTQIALIERISDGLSMDALDYGEHIVYQELVKLGFVDMQVAKRGKIALVLTDSGQQMRASGYISQKPVIRLTVAQLAGLRFLAEAARYFNDVPAQMKEPIRRLRIRGWATSDEDAQGRYSIRITTEGWQILKLVDV